MRGDRSPAFQFYAADWLADVNVRLLSFEQQGIYITLLCHCWLEGGIPENEGDLAFLLGMHVNRFRKVWSERLRGRFEKMGGGLLSSPRLERERKILEAFRQERSESGRKGAESKWRGKAQPYNSHATANGSANGSAIEEPMAKDGSPVSYLLSPDPPIVPQGDRASDLEFAEGTQVGPPPTPDPAVEVLEYLNARAGKSYRAVDGTLKPIRARLAEHSVEECRRVIDLKVKEWHGTERDRYLRPSTLFRPSNFEEYLGQAPKANGVDVDTSDCWEVPK